MQPKAVTKELRGLSLPEGTWHHFTPFKAASLFPAPSPSGAKQTWISYKPDAYQQGNPFSGTGCWASLCLFFFFFYCKSSTEGLTHELQCAKPVPNTLSCLFSSCGDSHERSQRAPGNWDWWLRTVFIVRKMEGIYSRNNTWKLKGNGLFCIREMFGQQKVWTHFFLEYFDITVVNYKLCCAYHTQ